MSSRIRGVRVGPGAGPASAVVLLLLVALSGCVNEPKLQAAPTHQAAVPPTSKIQQVLSQVPHYRVLGPSTVEVEVAHVGQDGWGFNATLVRIYKPVEPKIHRFYGSPSLIAFVPLELEKDAGACQPLPKGIHFRYESHEGLNQAGANANTLGGTYAPGWYHLVVVAAEPSSYRVTFNSTQELKIENLPAPDPYVTAGYRILKGQRSYEQSLPMENSWLAFAQLYVPARSADFGWDMSVGLTAGRECGAISTSRDMTSASVYQVMAEKRLWTGGLGTVGELNLRAQYKPKVDSPLVAEGADFEMAWVSWTSPRLADDPPAGDQAAR